MNQQSPLEEELERRLSELETVEVSDPAHAMLSGGAITAFIAVVVGVVAAAWIGASL
ncbi:hypothetical protein [Leucobacter ruminantium]|uniref:Uncharacterized protein n=1 Tax=Leucobacter ruminantium TaxID=1289170 RepID=A0A939LXY3_9MICO|nr:hypothetical protein [Leucobacter ruminantium]MBO1806517.1 hypothetical protein [Leucobacter ruminantium]